MARANHNSHPRLAAGLHLLGMAVSLAALLIGYRCILQPLAGYSRSAAAEAARSEQMIKQGPAIRARRDELLQTLEKLEQRTVQIRNRIPDLPQEGEFLGELTEIAQRQEVKIVDYRRGTTTQAETHARLTVDVQAEGAYAGICGMLDELASLPRMTRAQRLEISSEKGATDYTIRFTLVLYFGLRNAEPGEPKHG